MKIILFMGAYFILALTGNAQTSIPGVFSTGVDDSGNLLSAGQTDPYWTISSSPLGAVSALAVTSLDKNWVANTASSEWINANGMGQGPAPAGLYIYTLTFSLNGLAPSTAQITGEWASDNSSEIFLNGINTGFSDTSTGFKAFGPFSITNDFVAGENELQFYVTQDPDAPGGSGKGNPEGLQVNIFSATAEPVPEPTTLSLFALSMLGYISIKKRDYRRTKAV
ncbi:MAG TPA: PEP-CTERM sorting domain-containing protein [Verrucomicrobiae bacterium]|nr:PEP-CTERM sorting domain-containing protein [Verrucomicrobiae bacterium]